MRISNWSRASQGILRLSRPEWDQLDWVTKWLVSTRAAVLIMTFLSAALAGIFAWRDGSFIWWKWILLTLGLVLAHATNNILNDITDYKKGVDKDNYFRTQYGLQPLEMGFITEKQAYLLAGITGFLAVVSGLPLVLQAGTPGWILLALGVFFVLFYTWPLKYIGLGEIAVILVWGPLMVGGGYAVITGDFSWSRIMPVVLASLPYALGTTMVIFGKHIDKLVADRAKGIHTLPVILGEKTSRYVTLVMMVLQYVLVIYLMFTGYFSLVLLLVFGAVTTLPEVSKVYRAPKPSTCPPGYSAEVWPLYYVALAFVHNRKFGIFFLLGLLVDTALRTNGWLIR
jgi:1,4-dihydroxy-2-naphthoate polyprenyltransferase